MAKRRKVRVSFQKNRQKKGRRDGDLTRQYRDDRQAAEQAAHSERVRAKGGLSRKRTVRVEDDDSTLAISEDQCVRGRVLVVQGLYCTVVTDDGRTHRCYVRKLLKSMESEAQGVVAPGDWVRFKPAPNNEGLIYRVEPRGGALVRKYSRRERVIAANVEQVLIVGSLAEPVLKPNLIDRYLVSAEQAEIRPLIALNKIDLIEEGHLVEPIVGLYCQLGYSVVLTSATCGTGIEQLHDLLRGRETVVVGQSGVGKSSLLNALEPALHLKVAAVSKATEKGKHTTTNARLLRLHDGGTVVDTPGVRQFELWDVAPEELDGYFIEMIPFTPHCRMPGCTHTHEGDCAVKGAVDEGLISAGRYENYVYIRRGDSPG